MATASLETKAAPTLDAAITAVLLEMDKFLIKRRANGTEGFYQTETCFGQSLVWGGDRAQVPPVSPIETIALLVAPLVVRESVLTVLNVTDRLLSFFFLRCLPFPNTV